ncbi:MAG: YafY family protein [Imperialibacter sp.]|uniref:helix-turn-helix transcriptional regulator n=1 Tax=Imperialibacter sp. TaxID=2038411 RepID=UPI0032EE8A63
MNRIDRLFGVVTYIQSRKYTSLQQLAEKFDKSERTVFRDLRAISDMGLPLGFEPNKGYFITDGYFLPPVSFTNEEANALILMASLADQFTDKSIISHSKTAVEKVKAVLKGSQKEGVDHLHEQTRVLKWHHDMLDAQYLTIIQTAISNRQILKMTYENKGLETSTREVEPVGLLFYLFDWHMIAWCWKRNDYRDFRVVRIKKLECTAQPFKKQDHINLDDYIKNLPENFSNSMT